MPLSSAQRRYFDKTIHIQEIKDCISGGNEDAVIRVLEGLDYRLGSDFVRQHPIGSKFVLDFAFVKEQVAIEIDGESHSSREQKSLDAKRDKFLYMNNWVCIRIKDKDFFGYKKSFYKNLVREVVEERRQQWEKGRLYSIDIPEYEEELYTNIRSCVEVSKRKRN